MSDAAEGHVVSGTMYQWQCDCMDVGAYEFYEEDADRDLAQHLRTEHGVKP